MTFNSIVIIVRYSDFDLHCENYFRVKHNLVQIAIITRVFVENYNNRVIA